MDIASLISASRESMGMTQMELARQSKVSLPTIQNIEANKGNPSLETLERLLHALGMKLEVKVAHADWDLLAACGVPLLAESQRKHFTSRDVLIHNLKKACLELSVNTTPEAERKREAIQATLLAIKTHYPSVYKEDCRGRLFQKTFPKEITGRIIKLRRLALSRIQEYL
jgi:transcriptional regulator with XRE-family HTH domain